MDPFFERLYVISLEDSVDRRTYIRRHLSEQNLPDHEFHNAIGSSSEEVSRAYSSGMVKRYPPCFRCGKAACGKADCNNVLIPPQVAVFLTYLELWKKIATRREVALIVEDDVAFHPWWREVFSMLECQRDTGTLVVRPDVPTLVRLGWAENEEHMPNAPLYVSRQVRMSNPCHIITAAYAELLLDEFHKIDTTADIFLHSSSRASKSFSWTAHPPAATELSWSRGAFQSLIHPKPIRSEFLRAKGDDLAAERNDAAVASHIKHHYHRQFLVVGHPRCGTGFTAALLNQMELDIGHESDGRDGIATWMFAVNDIAPYSQAHIAQKREALHWDILIHAIRDPTSAIPSIMRDNIFAPASYQFRRKHIMSFSGIDLNHLENNFHRAVLSYLKWNEMITQMAPQFVFRIEKDHARLVNMIQNHHMSSHILPEELNLAPVNQDKPYKGVRYPKPRTSSKDWSSLPADLWADLVAFCCRHGYAIPDRQPHKPRSTDGPSCDLSGLDKLFLRPSGWTLSADMNQPVRSDGEALPWFTYSAIEFLERTISPKDRVFEYGAGNSTLWWQSRVGELYTVEQDASWAIKLKPSLQQPDRLVLRERFAKCPKQYDPIVRQFQERMRRTAWSSYDGQKVIRRGLDDDGFTGYAAQIMSYDGLFDIIVIDGMARRLCTEFAVKKIASDGMIILDNSNRRDYDAAYDILYESGFRQIPFWGLVPGANFMTCTSVFTRSLSRLAPAAHWPNSHGLPEY